MCLGLASGYIERKTNNDRINEMNIISVIKDMY